MADHPPQQPQPQPQALEDMITGNSCTVDLIQTFLDSITTSSTSNAHYTRDQIDISSIAALEEILLLQQQQQQQQQQYPRDVNTSSTTPTVVVTSSSSSSTDIPRSTGAELTLPESPPSNHHNHHHQTMTPNERYLYQQIQHNTQLLNELHQKMNVMMSHLLKIGGGEGGEGVSPTNTTTTTTTTTTAAAPSESLSPPTRRSKQDPPPPPQQQQQQQQQQPKTPPRYSFAVLRQQFKTLLWENQVTILLRKIVHLYILYYTLNQRYCRYHRQQQQQIRNNNNNNNQPNNNNNNNNFDPFMIFKVIFMMAILWSRVQQSSSTHHTKNQHHPSENEDENDTMNVVYTLQLVGAILLVVAFFMYRSGQFMFLYLFYYKYCIPQRVLLQHNNNINNQNNQNINAAEGDAAAMNNPHNTNRHMITADEIWNEHLLAVTEQEQQRLRQRQELQNQPLGPDGRRNGAVGGNPNPLEQMIHQIRRRIEWLLVHDWFRGEPIAVAAGVRRDNDTGEPREPNATPHTNNVQPEREQHASPIAKFVRMVLITVQDIIIFFVSFVLSILPVWRNIDPDALFRVFQQEQQQRMERQEHGNEANNENDDAVGALQQRQHNDGGIPMVQPPIDPAE
jgi:hypothetical protein